MFGTGVVAWARGNTNSVISKLAQVEIIYSRAERAFAARVAQAEERGRSCPRVFGWHVQGPRHVLALHEFASVRAHVGEHATASTTRQRSEQFGGMRFNADICSGDAHWVLPPELWLASLGFQRELVGHSGGDLGVGVRILVIATDAGAPALKRFGWRMQAVRVCSPATRCTTFPCIQRRGMRG